MSDIIKNEAEQGFEPICGEPLTKKKSSTASFGVTSSGI